MIWIHTVAHCNVDEEQRVSRYHEKKYRPSLQSTAWAITISKMHRYAALKKNMKEHRLTVLCVSQSFLQRPAKPSLPRARHCPSPWFIDVSNFLLKHQML